MAPSFWWMKLLKPGSRSLSSLKKALRAAASTIFQQMKCMEPWWKPVLFTETTPYAPNSPYSAIKASSDMIVRSYHHTYGLDTVITNCSNNYGPKQHDEKLIPTVIRKALYGENIPIYGDGKNIRDWLYVLDPCKGIDLVYNNGKTGEV